MHNILRMISATVLSIPLLFTPLSAVMTGTGSGTSDGTKNEGAKTYSSAPGKTPEAFIVPVNTPAGILPGVPGAQTELRGLWVATVVNIDWPKKPTTDVAALKKEALEALDFAKSHRFNAVFLQVRPTSDAFYASKLVPWSKYLTGMQGMAPADGFDPLQFWIDAAHERGIELHAWLNPYRITKSSAADPDTSLASLANGNPAKVHPDWVIRHKDGNLYYNPGMPEVRSFLLSCVSEIIDNYAVDGVHFDDYFYPDGSATKESGTRISAGGKATTNGKYASPFDDSTAYFRYGQGAATLDDWRRDNVNRLIQDVSALVHQKNPKLRFGVSPFAIWKNVSSDPKGSDTAGSESYTSHAADTRKWVKEGWIDYIMPQIYWQIGYKIADYQKISDWWVDVVKGTNVDLYIGQAAYRMDADDPASSFYGVVELEKQMAVNQKQSAVKGSVFFSYQSFVQRPGLADVLKGIWEKADGFSTPQVPRILSLLGLDDVAASKLGVQALKVARPPSSQKTNYSSFYITGTSNPDKTLYYNGNRVDNRSENGFFGFLVPLTQGHNTVVLSQEGSYVVRNLYRNKTSTGAKASPIKMVSAEIPSSSVYPQAPLYGQPGETYVLSCTAPIGAKVTVKVGGMTYNMTPATTKNPGKGTYPTTYKFSWVMPKQSGTARVVDAGAPVYKSTYLGKTKTRSAPAKVGIVMPGSPFYATMTGDPSESYQEMSTSGGTWFYLPKGTRDAVTGIVSNYARLASGLFVKTNVIRLDKEKNPIVATVSAADYAVGGTSDVFRFSMSAPVAVTTNYDGKKLRISVPLATSLALPVLSENTLFSAVSTEKSGSGLRYIFTIKEGEQLDGFAPVQNNLDYHVVLKRHIVSIAGERPLTGKTILLDPGHGGDVDDPDGDTGAIGPLGSLWSERNINLENAWVIKAELEKLGAMVTMTRTDDSFVSLKARLDISRALQPDLFIAIHADSMNDNVDISKLSGFSVFYREPLAASLGEAVRKNVVEGLGKKDRRLNKKNFYVIRGTWAPSILIEMGFVPNPVEFEKLIDPVEQARMASAIGSAVVQWYAKANE